MNRSLVIATVLAAGLATTNIFAQDAAPAAAAPAAQTPAPAAPTTPPPPPQALPAKIAIIDFEATTGATNEGQKLSADIQKKYAAREDALKARAAELDNLKKQLQALPANTPDDERAKRIKDIDLKDNQFQRDYKDLQDEAGGEFQDGFGKLLQKVGPVAVKYASDNGFTLLLNQSRPQNALPTLIWWNQSTDISQAVVDAYNLKSGVAAPAPSAPNPAPAHHTTTTPAHPATHTTAPATTPSH